MIVDPSVPTVAAGLIGGFAVARYSGRRELGGVVLAAAYLGAFGVSHPLAKKLGAWPSVLTVTAAATGLTAAVTSQR